MSISFRTHIEMFDQPLHEFYKDLCDYVIIINVKQWTVKSYVQHSEYLKYTSNQLRLNCWTYPGAHKKHIESPRYPSIHIIHAEYGAKRRRRTKWPEIELRSIKRVGGGVVKSCEYPRWQCDDEMRPQRVVVVVPRTLSGVLLIWITINAVRNMQNPRKHTDDALN